MCFSLPNPSIIKCVSCLGQKFEKFPFVAQIDSHFALLGLYSGQLLEEATLLLKHQQHVWHLQIL